MSRGGRQSPSGLCEGGGVAEIAAGIDRDGTRTNTTTEVGSYDGELLQLKPALQAEHGAFLPGNPLQGVP